LVINGKTGAGFVTVAMGSGLSSRINLVILDGAHDFPSTLNTGPGRNSRASPFGAKTRLMHRSKQPLIRSPNRRQSMRELGLSIGLVVS
jgi:hypothetical protein